MNYFQLQKCQVDGGPPSNRSSETAKFVYLQKINDNMLKWAGGYLMIAGSAGFTLKLLTRLISPTTIMSGQHNNTINLSAT